MKKMSATQARVHFGQVLRALDESDEPIEVAHKGRPAAVLLSPAAYRQLVERGGAELPDVFEQIDAILGAEPAAEFTTEDIVNELRAGRREREEQLDALLR